LAKLLHSNSTVKSCPDGKSPLGGKNLTDWCFKNISKGDLTPTFKATRNHASVTENAEMVTEAIAEHALTHVIAGHIRPGEAITIFKV
jgi:hypothetical protein